MNAARRRCTNQAPPSLEFSHDDGLHKTPSELCAAFPSVPAHCHTALFVDFILNIGRIFRCNELVLIGRHDVIRLVTLPAKRARS